MTQWTVLCIGGPSPVSLMSAHVIKSKSGSWVVARHGVQHSCAEAWPATWHVRGALSGLVYTHHLLPRLAAGPVTGPVGPGR